METPNFITKKYMYNAKPKYLLNSTYNNTMKCDKREMQRREMSDLRILKEAIVGLELPLFLISLFRKVIRIYHYCLQFENFNGFFIYFYSN